jgi:hypothetical protein
MKKDVFVVLIPIWLSLTFYEAHLPLDHADSSGYTLLHLSCHLSNVVFAQVRPNWRRQTLPPLMALLSAF